MSPGLVRCTLVASLALVTLSFAQPASPGAPPEGATGPTTRPASQPATRPVAELEAERIATAEEAYRLAAAQYRAGLVSSLAVSTWSQRRARAVLDSGLPLERKVTLLNEYVDQARAAESLAQVQSRAGMSSGLDVSDARYARIEAEIWLARACRGGESRRRLRTTRVR